MKQTRTLKELKIVRVEWVDSTTRHDISMPIDEAIKETLVKAETIGYLIYKDEEKTIVSSCIFVDDEDLNVYPKTVYVIPTKCIKNITEL